MYSSTSHKNFPGAFARNLFFACFIFFGSIGSAGAQKSTDSSITPASVSYLGYMNDQLSFLLSYETRGGEKYSVTITDAEGHALFSQVFTEKKFNKIFKTPSDNGNLTFIISNPKRKEEKKFQVSTERRMVEEFSITKVNK